MIRTIKFYKEIRTGSSLPLIVGGSDGNKYVVKPTGSGEGVTASVVEWLSCKLGRLLQVPTLTPVLLVIDADLAEEAKDPEIRELLERSVGINLGTRFLEDASPYNEHAASGIDGILKSNIFLFDLFLLNIDRTSRNPNMIIDDDGLWCLDHSSSITMKSVIDGRNYREQAALSHIKRHPFYGDEIEAGGFIKRLEGIRDKSIRDIVEGLPEEWVHQPTKVMSDRLVDKKNRAASLREMLEELKAVVIETEEERRARVLNNRRAFEQKVGN